MNALLPFEKKQTSLTLRLDLGIMFLAFFAVGCQKFEYAVPSWPSAKEQLEYATSRHRIFLNSRVEEEKEMSADIAIAAYQKVVDDFPLDTLHVNGAKTGIAQVYKERLEYKQALKLYNELIETCPTDDKIQLFSMVAVAEIYAAMGEDIKSRHAYRAVCTKFEFHPVEAYRKQAGYCLKMSQKKAKFDSRP